MKDEQQPFHNSRIKQREKRRKTNIILNSLIVIVLLLIVIVSVQIFFKDDKKTASVATEEQVATEKEPGTLEHSNKADKADDINKDTASAENRNKTAASKDNEDEKNPADKDSDKKDAKVKEDSEIVTEGGNDPDVKKTIVNPAWEPVGTAQTGEHSNSYGGVDWDEMVQAISYATGIDQGNMTIHYLGNNGENKSVGTIQAKDTKQKYRVYIEWVDEKGWKPTLVEELTE
ncbi:YrrS family protein [Bacillus benzoevorans]